MKVLGLAYKLGHQKFSLSLGLVSFGSGDETSLGQHSMYLPSFSLVPRLLCMGGGERAWYTLFAHAPSSLGNLHTTPLH